MKKMKDVLWAKSIWILVFVLLTFLGYGLRLGTGNAVHSDETSIIFVGQDWMSGNFFLKNWWFSTGTFGLTTFELTLFTAIFGYHDTLIYIVAGMNYAVMIMTVIFVIYKYAKKYEVSSAWVYSAIAGLVIIVPRQHMLLHAGTQVLGYAVAVMCMYFTWTVKTFYENVGIRVIWGVLLGVLAVTNNMFLYNACVPILLTGIIVAYIAKAEKGRFSLVEIGVVSVGSCVIFQKVWEVFRGESLGGLNTVFTTRDKIWSNLGTALCNILEIYGINFWGENLFSIKTLSALIGLFVFGKFTVEIGRFIKNKYWKDEILFNMFLTMAIVNFGAYTFSSVAEAAPDTHLLEPFLLGYTMAGCLAWMKNANEGKNDIWKMLILSFLLLILMCPKFTLQQPDNSGRQQAALYLVENGYKRGFATFWSAASVMYESKGELVISPVSCYSTAEAEKPTLHAQQWMNKEDWARQEGNFLVLDSTSLTKGGVDEEGIISTFGSWSEKQEFGEIIVYTWDEFKTLEE